MIQTRGVGRSSMLNSSNISSSNLDLKQRHKMQSKNAGIHHTLLKKDQQQNQGARKRKGTASELRQKYSSTVCFPGTAPPTKALIFSGVDPHNSHAINRGVQQKNQDSSDRGVGGGGHSERSEPESRRAFSSQQATQPLSLEKKKQELKQELARQMRRQQNSGSDMRMGSKNSYSKEVSGGSQNHSLQKVRFEDDQDMMY